MDLTFKLILNYATEKSGVNLRQYRENYIRRRIELRMRVLGVESPQAYFKILKRDESEVRKLLETITINVTEFMRDVTPFEYFKKVIVPKIVERKSNVSNIIRIWSAGSSCGEEPYSIAIILSEVLGEAWNYRIYATDIDETCLKKAKDGIYGESQLRNLDRVLIKKYFERVDEKNYRIRDAVKKHVTFKRHDLTTEPPVSRYLDAVFCRNVMIYFTEAQKMKVLNDFYNALISGGYLIIGKSETLPSEFKEKFECVDLREKIYLKKL